MSMNDKMTPIDDFIEQRNEQSLPPLKLECNVTEVKANIKRHAQTTEVTAAVVN